MHMKKVLVVDDETDMQVLFEQRFRKEIRDRELEFAFACSGKEALAFMQGHKQEHMLILSDINMPGMSGLELLQHVKSKYSNPPPVFMMISAYGDEGNYRNAISLGADGFFSKPLDFPLLKEKLKSSQA